jgi:hypothetical protein
MRALAQFGAHFKTSSYQTGTLFHAEQPEPLPIPLVTCSETCAVIRN